MLLCYLLQVVGAVCGPAGLFRVWTENNCSNVYRAGILAAELAVGLLLSQL